MTETVAAHGGTIPPLSVPSELSDREEVHRKSDLVELDEMDGDTRWNNLSDDSRTSVHHLPDKWKTVSTVVLPVDCHTLMDALDVLHH